MAEIDTRENEERRPIHQTRESAEQSEHFPPPTQAHSYPSSLLGDARLSGRGNEPVRVALMRQMQETYGNRALQRLLHPQQVAGSAPRDIDENPGVRAGVERGHDMANGPSQLQPSPSPLRNIEQTSRAAAANPGVEVMFAGSVAEKAAPGGAGAINGMNNEPILGGIIPGWTGIKNAPAFTPPTFETANSVVEREGNQKDHYAWVRPTGSKDAEHESYYPGPGDHEHPTHKSQVKGGKTFKYFLRISKAMSDLIKSGEQEHLDDAQRAYDITYKLVADKINALSKPDKKFGPATTPDKANQMAEAALMNSLPAKIGADTGGGAKMFSAWPQMLDKLLGASKKRDNSGWHTLDTNAPKRENQGNNIVNVIEEVSTTSSTAIGKHPSDEVVDYS